MFVVKETAGICSLNLRLWLSSPDKRWFLRRLENSLNRWQRHERIRFYLISFVCLWSRNMEGTAQRKLWDGKTASWPSAIKSTEWKQHIFILKPTKEETISKKSLEWDESCPNLWDKNENWKGRLKYKRLINNTFGCLRCLSFTRGFSTKTRRFHVSDRTVVSLITSTLVGTSTFLFHSIALLHTHLLTRCVLDNQFWQDQTLKNPRHSSFSCSRDVRTMHAPSENGWNLNKTPQTQTQYISIQEENTGRRADLMNVKLNIYRMCSFCPAANQNEDASLCQRCKMSRPISRKNPSNILFLGPQTNTFWETRDGVQEAGF